MLSVVPERVSHWSKLGRQTVEVTLSPQEDGPVYPEGFRKWKLKKRTWLGLRSILYSEIFIVTEEFCLGLKSRAGMELHGMDGIVSWDTLKIVDWTNIDICNIYGGVLVAL